MTDAQTVYVDDSGSDTKSRVAAAAFCVSTVERWQEFLDEWRKIADRAGFELKDFHMTEFAACRHGNPCQQCRAGKTSAREHPWQKWPEKKRENVLNRMAKALQKKDTSMRLVQATFAMALAMPVSLVTMLAIPIDLSLAVQTLFSFLLFSAAIAIPFFFSGVAVCLCLTQMPFPIGHIYFADLIGASPGCLAAVALLKTIDAPSGMILIGALLSLSTAEFSAHFGEAAFRRRAYLLGLVLWPRHLKLPLMTTMTLRWSCHISDRTLRQNEW